MNQHVSLTALRLASEAAAGRYLAARRAALADSRRVAALHVLVRQHPTRVDYRAAWETARSDFLTAQARAHRAYDQVRHRRPPRRRRVDPEASINRLLGVVFRELEYADLPQPTSALLDGAALERRERRERARRLASAVRQLHACTPPAAPQAARAA